MSEKFVLGKRRGELTIKAWLHGIEVDRSDGIALRSDIHAVEDRLAKIAVELTPTLKLSFSAGKSVERQVDEIVRASFSKLISEMKSQSIRIVNYNEPVYVPEEPTPLKIWRKIWAGVLAFASAVAGYFGYTWIN